jgi:hypothetical protein
LSNRVWGTRTIVGLISRDLAPGQAGIAAISYLMLFPCHNQI